MNKVIQLQSPNDEQKIQEMNQQGYTCVLVYQNPVEGSWYGLFYKPN